MRGIRIVAVALALGAAGGSRAGEGWKAVAPAEAEAAAEAEAGRRPEPLRYALELEGKPAGWVRSVEGGGPVGEVGLFRSGGDPVARKLLTALHYEPIRLAAGAVLSPDVAAWIRDFLAGNPASRDGAIVAVDARGQVRARLTFHDALLTELEVPALDARSREPIVLGLVLAPERTILDRNPGRTANLPPVRRAREVTDFAFSVDRLDGRGVVRVEPLVFSRPIVSRSEGGTRDTVRELGPLTVPDPVVTVSASRADEWYRWTDDFLVGGDSGDARRRSGRLSLLGPDLSEVLAIGLDRVGIRGLRTFLPSGEALQRVQATLYVERAALVVP